MYDKTICTYISIDFCCDLVCLVYPGNFWWSLSSKMIFRQFRDWHVYVKAVVKVNVGLFKSFFLFQKFDKVQYLFLSDLKNENVDRHKCIQSSWIGSCITFVNKEINKT